MLKEALISIIGEYAPNTDGMGNYLYGLASVDYTFILSSLILMLFIYCLFRLLGGLFHG